MKRTMGTLAAGLLLALCTVVMFANRTMAAADPAAFDTVVVEIDSTSAAFVAANLKANSFFVKRFDKAKTQVLKAKGLAPDGNKRIIGAALKNAESIYKGIKQRLTNNNARKQIPEDVRNALLLLLTDLRAHTKALK